MRYEGTINLGHVLTIATMIIGMAAAYSTYKVTIQDHDARIARVEKTIETQLNLGAEFTNTLYTIKQDIALIKYRMEQQDSRK